MCIYIYIYILASTCWFTPTSATANASMKSCHNPCQSHSPSTFVKHIRQAHLLSTFARRTSFVQLRPSQNLYRSLSIFVPRSSFFKISWSNFVCRSSFVDMPSVIGLEQLVAWNSCKTAVIGLEQLFAWSSCKTAVIGLE